MELFTEFNTDCLNTLQNFSERSWVQEFSGPILADQCDGNSSTETDTQLFSDRDDTISTSSIWSYKHSTTALLLTHTSYCDIDIFT